MNDRELMQIALDALDKAAEEVYSQNDDDEIGQARRALRARLAQPEPEPVAEVKLMNTGGNAGISTVIREIDNPIQERLRPGQKLYTAPPQREWKGLTTAERKVLWMAADNQREFGEMIEAKLKEKNT